MTSLLTGAEYCAKCCGYHGEGFDCQAMIARSLSAAPSPPEVGEEQGLRGPSQDKSQVCSVQPDRGAEAANDGAALGVEIGVLEVFGLPGHWLVEAVDHGVDGTVYRATFDGCNAKARAHAYAEWFRQSVTGSAPALDREAVSEVIEAAAERIEDGMRNDLLALRASEIETAKREAVDAILALQGGVESCFECGGSNFADRVCMDCNFAPSPTPDETRPG